jgi:hypothetical protein
VFEMPAMIAEKGVPYRPLGVMWVEVDSTFVVDIELVKPGDELTSAPQLFTRATMAPKAGPPRVPSRLRVDSPELAAALRGSIGDVEVVVAPTPELDEPIRSLTERFAGPDQAADDDDFTYLTEDITPPLVGAFFASCARLFELAPWSITPSDEFLSVSCEMLGIEAGALCFVGQSGTAFGFSLFRSESDASRYMIESGRHTPGELPRNIPAHIMMTFDHRDACPPGIVREVAAQGWPVAGLDAYPSAFMIGANCPERPLERGELVAVTAIVEGLCALIETAPGLADAWDDGEACAWHGEVAVPGGVEPIEIALEAPLWLPDVELDEGEALDDRADEILDGLAVRVSGDPDVLDWAEMLSRQAIDYHRTLLHELAPDQLDDVLFGVIPRRVMAEATDAPAIIAALRAYLAYAAQRPEPGHAAPLLAGLPADATQRLARRLADPRLFGQAKTLMTAGARAGFDMTSNEGIERFLATTGGRLPELGPTRAKPRSATRSPAKPAAKTKRKPAKLAKKARKKSRSR